MADDAIRAFRAIQTKHERHKALRGLLQSMSIDERQCMFSLISQQHDPLSVLPVELVLHIFGHLSLFCTWNLQRVSKRWQAVLSSEDHIRSALSRWDTHDQSDSGCPQDLLAKRSIESRLGHLRAIKTRQHLGEQIFNDTGTGLQGPQPQMSLRRLEFQGRRIAYISSHRPQGDAVIVRDLVSGEERILRGEAREGILAVVLTTCLVAWVTFDGFLYVSYHQEPTDKINRTQLPSSRVRTAAADDEAIVLGMGGTDRSSAYISELIFYDARRRRLQSFPMDDKFRAIETSGRRLNSCSLLVNASGQTIDLFFLLLKITYMPDNAEPEKCLQVTHVRVSFSGTWLASNAWKEAVDYHRAVRDHQYLLAAPRPSGRRGEYRVAVCEVPFMGGLPFRLSFAVLFDSEHGRFLGDEGEAAQIPMNDGEVKEMDTIWKGQRHRPDMHGNWLEYCFSMNDTFLVSLEVSKLMTSRSRIRVLCFDPDVQMKRNEKEHEDLHSSLQITCV